MISATGCSVLHACVQEFKENGHFKLGGYTVTGIGDAVLIQSFVHQILCTYYVLGTLLGSENTAVHKIDHEAYISVKGRESMK